MAAATTEEKFCSVCDFSIVKAVEWCTDCDEFLCSDCLKHHKASKLFKKHTTITTERYEELPEFVKTLSYACLEHGEQLEFFCSVHNCSCCAHCLLDVHKDCSSVTPLKNVISSAKSSPSLLDLEQNINDLFSYVEKLKLDREKNKEEIQNQKLKIRDEILIIRKSINSHLDKLELDVMECLNNKVSTSTSGTDEVLTTLNEIDQRIHNLSSDLVTLKEHASELQIFLSLPHLTTSLMKEEKIIDKLNNDGKLNGIEIGITSELDKFLSLGSLANVQVRVKEGRVTYLKEKEKQAQIIGTVKQISINNISLKTVQEIRTKAGLSKRKVGYSSQTVSGCCVVNGTQLLFSEYNTAFITDRLVLTNLTGVLIRRLNISDLQEQSPFDITKINDSTLAVTCNDFFCIVDIDAEKSIFTSSIRRNYNYYGVTYFDRHLYICSCEEGIIKFDIDSKSDEILVKRKFKEFSYICCDGKRLFHTTGDDSVFCCDMKGTHLWEYKDTSLLQLPRGIVVDKNGLVYVAGENSNNIVVLSPDGLNGKELCKFSNPRAMCYDKTKHKLLVCDTSDKATWFQIEETY